MKKFLLLLTTVFLLAACNSDDDSNGTGKGKANGKGDGGTKSDVFAVSKGSAVNTTSFWGTWESQPLTISGIVIKMRFQFKPNRVVAASQCTFPDGVTLYAQVSSEASYFNDVVTIYENREDLAVFNQNGKDYTCSASVESDTQEINIISGKIYGDDFVLTKIAD